ncbi:MAG: hypothetical protein HYY17_14625 [Planctomycetes bacterium]|nr:hypothetical protein [Planctomycetota bacterium]
MKWIALCAALLVPRQEADERKKKEEAVKKRLQELFELCRKDEHEKAAPYFVYRKDDKARRWKDVYDFSKDEEKKEVVELCKRIKALLKEYEGFEFGRFLVEKESEGEWCVIEVIFKKAEKRKKNSFAFLRIRDAYCLGDID